MKRLALGAAIVVAALVVGYVLVRPLLIDVNAAPPARHAPADAVRRDRPAVVQADPGTPVTSAGVTPEVPSRAHRRDHRSITDGAGNASAEVPVYPPGARRVAPQVTSALATELRVQLASCADPSSGLRVDGTVTIAIRGHQLRVLEADLRRSEPSEASGEAEGTALARCLRAKALGVTTQAVDEPDLERYAITLALILR